ncbi:MAG: DUF5336 domain-containing protein [Sciscionella sp.]
MTHPSSGGQGMPQHPGGRPQQAPGGYQGQFQQAGPGAQPQGMVPGNQPAGDAGTRQFAPAARQRPNPLGTVSLGTWLGLGVLVLALVSYIIGLATAGASFEIELLLAGGLLCVLRLVPQTARAFLPIGAVLSTVGGLGILADVVGSSGARTSAVLVMIFGILQFLVAIMAYLVDAGVITMPVPAPPRSGVAGGWAQAQQPVQYGAPQQQFGARPPYSTQQPPYGARPSPEQPAPQPGQYGQPPAAPSQESPTQQG